MPKAKGVCFTGPNDKMINKCPKSKGTQGIQLFCQMNPTSDTRNVTALTPQATLYRGAEHTRSHTARAVKDGCANGHILELYYDPRSTTLQLFNPY